VIRRMACTDSDWYLVETNYDSIEESRAYGDFRWDSIVDRLNMVTRYGFATPYLAQITMKDLVTMPPDADVYCPNVPPSRGCIAGTVWPEGSVYSVIFDYLKASFSYAVVHIPEGMGGAWHKLLPKF